MSDETSAGPGIDRLQELLRARVEYEISDASRDGPRVHQRTSEAMALLSAEVLGQAAQSAERCDELAAAAQRGIKNLIEVATGAQSQQEWQDWIERHSS